MVTVDPIRDSPDVLSEFVEGFVPGARALRSDDDPAALRAVADRLGASYVDADSMPTDTTAGHGGDHAAGDVGHTSYIYVLDPTGSTVLVWPEGAPVDDMVSDLAILLERVDGAT